jgi:proteasome accessory factor B
VLNLLALLLETSVPLTREEIMRDVAGYPEQLSAYRRAFERDKETLRGMGVPITTETIGDGSDVGYRVLPDDYYLPDFGLTPEETAALHVAVSAVSLGDQAGIGALMKLGGGVAEEVAPIASLPLAPALATLFEAFRRRAVVTFRYRGASRTVEPWGLSSKRGHWYVVGFDRDRAAIRAFRADRVDGDVVVGEPGGFDPPEAFRPDDHVESRPWLLGDEPPVAVRIAVDDAQRDAMLAQLGSDGSVVDETDDTAGETIIELVVTNRSAFRAFLLGFSDSVRVIGPPDVRGDMVAWLERLAAAS